MAMDTKDLRTESVLTIPINDGNANYHQSSTMLPTKRNKSYQDIGSNSLGKLESQGTRPCAIIGPDRILPPPPASDIYLKKPSVEPWSCNENVYRLQTDFAPKLPEYQQVRNISPRQTFQENMQRIMVPPSYNSNKNIEDPNLKGSKDSPLEVKYCEVPYPINHTINGQKSIRNSDIPMTSVNPAFSRTLPPHGWPNSVSARPVRPFGAPEYYQYPEFANYTHARTIPRPLRTPHHDPAQVNAEHLYHEGNVRFKPYPTIKERYSQGRYDYGNNYPNQFHPHGPFPPQKFDLPKTVTPHPYPMYSQVPMRRITEPIIDSYQRSNQPANFSPYHNHYIPTPYGPVPGNCIQNKMYSVPSELPTKPSPSSKLPYDINNKIYLEYENNISKMYPPVDNMYYRDLNRQHLSKNEVAVPVHPGLMQYNMPPQYLYRKDNMPMKPFDNIPYRNIDHNIHGNNPLLRHPMQYSSSGLVISPGDSNVSNDMIPTLGNLQEDCGYVSQSSTASGRSMDSGNYRLQNEILRKHESYYNSNIKKYSKQVSRSDNSDKKSLNVRQFLQMWNEGEEEGTDSNNPSTNNNINTNSETIRNQDQLYVLGLVNIPNEELSKYEHIQKISKLPENIKGYNSIELLDQYEQLVETPTIKQSKMTTIKDYQISPKTVAKPSPLLPRPVSPLDVEAKISQSVIHKEVGCNFEIKPCSPKMLNADIATPSQNILDERAIEKVINLGLVNSSILTNNPDNITSCKMNSPYISNNDIMKSNNYSFQELESNSGVCLASLPRLDSDIELNFPEINQQFIDANRINSNTKINNLDVTSDNNLLSADVPECNVEKESSKLSKYRKNKMHDPLDAKIHQCIVNRTDSVIIKNPDKVRNQEEIITNIATISNENNEMDMNIRNIAEDASRDANSIDDNIALDFSLNRMSEKHKNESECKNLPDFSLEAGQDSQNVSEKEMCINNVETKILPENDKIISNNDLVYSNALSPILASTCEDINPKCTSEVGLSQENVLLSPLKVDTKTNDDVFLNEIITKDSEDHLKNIEKEVENIKLKLPSLCVDSVAIKEDTKEFIDECYEEIVKGDKEIESEHKICNRQHQVVNIVIEDSKPFKVKNDSYIIDQDVTIESHKNNVGEMPVDHQLLLGKTDLPYQSAKEVIKGEQLQKECLLTEESSATKQELTTYTDSTLHLKEHKNDILSTLEHSNVINNNNNYIDEPTNLFLLNLEAPNENKMNTGNSLVKPENIDKQKCTTLKTNVSTLDSDSTTIINNSYIVNSSEKLKQETLAEIYPISGPKEDEDSEKVLDNNSNVTMSNLVIGEEVKSSTCSTRVESQDTTSYCDISAEAESVDKLTRIHTMKGDSNETDQSLIAREAVDMENDSIPNISTQMSEIQDFIEEIKADVIHCSPILDMDIDHELLLNENNIDNQTILLPGECDNVASYTKCDSVPMIQKYFWQKYFSPRLQNLFLYSEGVCATIPIQRREINEIKQCGSDILRKAINETTTENCEQFNAIDTGVSEKEDYMRTPERITSVFETESCVDEILHIEEIKNSDVEDIRNYPQNQSHQDTKNQNCNENCDVKDNSNVSLKSRQTLKRSLSDSAIEIYNGTKDQLDVNREFLNKRQKIIPNELLEQEEGDDFCSIAQNNRRNSISICNSDNLYILIDNDYMIEEDGECSDKIFTEVSTEFCIESDPVLNLCVTDDTEVDSAPENNTMDSFITSGPESIENTAMHDSWDIDCVETIFNDDVAEDIIISAPTSPGNLSFDANDDERSEKSDSESEHMVKLKEIYGDTMCTDDVHLVETLYNTPQMDVNRTLVDIESQNIQDTFDGPMYFPELENPEDANIHEELERLEYNVPNENEVENKLYKHQDYIYSDCVVDSADFCDKEYVALNNKENDIHDSASSSPEVSSTTSEEKCSSILLKITSVNGSRTSQINNISDNSNRVSYKLTEVEDYTTNYRPLITKAAKKYIPPLKESQDLKVKLPLPQQSLDKLKRLKITKNKPIIANTTHRTNHMKHDIPKKIKPKFEDVLRSIDEIQFKTQRDKTKKVKHSIPKVVIKKNENGAHYASTPNRDPNYNPDLTGRKWQPWVFIERNEFVDKMAQRNKAKAVYCHRKKTFVLAEKFKKYKSICTAKFFISQPNPDSGSAGNLKYTIKLKHNY